MGRSSNLGVLILLCLFATSDIERREHRESKRVDSSGIKGKVFRSDSNEAISNSYILLERDSPARAEHFDVRTNEKGDYQFRDIPVGKYKISIYAWFPNRSSVPCQLPSEAKTVDDGKVSVEWQFKSRAFMEIVTIESFSIDAREERVKDFDLFCK
jgi:hypothetical protein